MKKKVIGATIVGAIVSALGIIGYKKKPKKYATKPLQSKESEE